MDDDMMLCPRCHGDGFVDVDDIKRLEMVGHWIPGPCKYCNAWGEIRKSYPLNHKVNDPNDTWEIEFDS